MKDYISKIGRVLKTDADYLIKSGFWLNLGTISGAIISFVVTILFAKYVPKDLYGIYKYILSLAGIAGAFSLSGMNVAVMRSVAQGFPGIFKKAITEQVKWSLPQIIFLLIFSSYYFIAGNSLYGYCLLIVTLLYPISNISNTYSAFLTGKKDFKTNAFYGISSNIAYFLIMTAAIVFASDSAVILITSYFIATGLINAFFCYRTYKKYHLDTDVTYRDEDITYSKHNSVMSAISILAAHADSFIVYHMLGPVYLAYYSFATVIPERIRTMFGFIASAAFPKIAERDLSKINIKTKTFQLIVLSIIISLAYIVSAPFIFKIFLSQYANVVLYSQIFSLSLVAIATNISFTALQAHKKQRELYIINLVVPITKIAVTVIGILTVGMWGAIIAKMLHHFMMLGLTSLYANKKE